MNVSREVLYEALKAQLATTPGIAWVGRRLLSVDDVNAANFPALVIDEMSEAVAPLKGVGAKWTITVDVLLYTAQPPADQPSYSLANPLLDALQLALAPPAYSPQVQTLGGVVQHCWIEGKIEKHGWLNDKIVVVVPVMIVTTD